MKIVISLGGSLINPGKVDYNFLKQFKKTISKLKKHKIIIVTGGGKIAREYINTLRDEKLNEKVLSLIGIKTTKLNAMLVSNFLNTHILIPDSLIDLGRMIKKNKVVVCGALGYKPNMTSDGTAADISRWWKADMFINMTNVKGLYDKDPRKYKNAKFISKISFNDFLKRANKIKFKAGQHFVLDQTGARIITKYKIKTVILKGNKNLENCIKGKKFIGTVID